MKWILAIVLCLGLGVTAEARPHLKGKVRGWWHLHRHQTTSVVVVPKCGCDKDCKCEKGKCKCDKKHKCTPKCKCGEVKKETLIYKPKCVN